MCTKLACLRPCRGVAASSFHLVVQPVQGGRGGICVPQREYDHCAVCLQVWLWSRRAPAGIAVPCALPWRDLPLQFTTRGSPLPALARPLLPPQMPNLHFIPCIPITTKSFDNDVYVATSEPHGERKSPANGSGRPGSGKAAEGWVQRTWPGQAGIGLGQVLRPPWR